MARLITVLAALSAVLCLTLPGMAQEAEKPKEAPPGASPPEVKSISVAVFPFEAKGFEPKTVKALNDVFLGEARKIKGYKVVSTGEVEQLLNIEQQKQMLGCNDNSCAVEIAGALGVDSVVLGGLARIGKSITANIRRVNSRTAEIEANHSETISATEGAEEDVLLAAVRRAAKKVFPGEALAEPETGGGRVWTWVAGGVGLAALAVGIVGTVLLTGAKSDADKSKGQDVTQQWYDDTKSRGERGALLSNIGYAVGGAALAGAVVLFFLEAPGDDAQPMVFRLLPAGNGVVMRW